MLLRMASTVGVGRGGVDMDEADITGWKFTGLRKNGLKSEICLMRARCARRRARCASEMEGCRWRLVMRVRMSVVLSLLPSAEDELESLSDGRDDDEEEEEEE